MLQINKSDMKNIHTISIIFILAILSFNVFTQNIELSIIHTNDIHSQIEPINKNVEGFMADKGGIVRLLTYIDQEKSKNNNVLLLDAGDFSQGSSFYSIYHGEVEIAFMNTINYDAATLGNHEFDLGMENLAKLVKSANFPFVNCNYDFTNTPLNGLIKPYIIIHKSGLKIGIFGLGPQNLSNLTFKKNVEGILYKDTFESAYEIADKLKNEEECDLVICLSHIGWDNKDAYSKTGVNVCDSTLALHSKDIDIIIGGHSHTYMEQGKVVENINGQPVYINQTSGVTATVGKMDIVLEAK